jgi:hypothetical protein
MSITPARFAEHLDDLLGDLLGPNGEQVIPVPAKVCTAILSLLQYLLEDQPDLLPQELRLATIHINNFLGDPVYKHTQDN